MPRKCKNFLVIDTETATLPFVNEWNLTNEDKKKISIAKPLIYDIGWTIANRTNGTIAKRNFLVAEIFCVPAIFNTAYYREKRPLYLEMMKRGEITVLPWNDIIEILLADLEECSYICAYNAMFDAKKALPFTDLYISKLYSPDYHEWEEQQKSFCERILRGKANPNPKFDKDNFCFRGREYPMIDVWAVSCAYLLNNNKFKSQSVMNGLLSSTGLYFSTSAEVAKQYLSQRFDFIEDHTALSDAEIETELLFAALKRGKIIEGLVYFPFRMLGETIEYITSARGVTKQMATIVKKRIEEYLPDKDEDMNQYEKNLFGKKMKLERFIEDKWQG